MPRRQRACRVIQRLFCCLDLHRHSSNRARHLPRRPQRRGIPFDGKDTALEWGHTEATERLQGMHRAGRCAEFADRIEYARIQRPARVQHDLLAKFLSADTRQLLRHVRQLSVGRGHQKDARRERLPRQVCKRLPGADEPHGAARGRQTARHDGADFPPAFPQPSSQRLTHAPATDNGHAPRHRGDSISFPLSQG